MKINKKNFALQLPKQDFYSFKLCTVEDQKFNSLNVLVAAKTKNAPTQQR